ncbi:hypothetical protein JWG44_00140 [Leptospira sp. 201903071]|uniref:hypothetical protein n=1 Tax=Leptospira ainazelensis TaxID=2810034 RepID=UPI001965DED3|nr:hypothetical protein [Leptospira ainazelensis]MBM9498662.1 hypothetical protein [Leptospira ainazelensis]
MKKNEKFLNLIFLSTLFLQSACAPTHDYDLPNSWFFGIVTLFVLSISCVILLALKKWFFISVLVGVFTSSLIYLISAVMLITYDDTCNDRRNLGECWSNSSLTLKEGIVTVVCSFSAVLFYVFSLFTLIIVIRFLSRYLRADKKEK